MVGTCQTSILDRNSAAPKARNNPAKLLKYNPQLFICKIADFIYLKKILKFIFFISLKIRIQLLMNYYRFNIIFIFMTIY